MQKRFPTQRQFDPQQNLLTLTKMTNDKLEEPQISNLRQIGRKFKFALNCQFWIRFVSAPKNDGHSAFQGLIFRTLVSLVRGQDFSLVKEQL